MSNWHAQKTYTETPHGKGSPDVFYWGAFSVRSFGRIGCLATKINNLVNRSPCIARAAIRG
ncbi:hypothetical protein ACN081_06605 [Rothia sp. P13129]|uniref:hypothetical protein n=1 Tax=Rothia sp. P13129 TaxID=3402664 RepID=UPI003AC8FCE3